MIAVELQAEAGARRGETDLDLGTDRHPLEILPQRVGQKAVLLVPPSKRTFRPNRQAEMPMRIGRSAWGTSFMLGHSLIWRAGLERRMPYCRRKIKGGHGEQESGGAGERE